MRRFGFHLLALAFTVLALPVHAANAVPDFHLEDVNDESARFETMVSPRDYILQATGYYFGHAS